MKKVLVLFLSMVLVLSLCSCGKKPGAQTTESSSVDSSSQQDDSSAPVENQNESSSNDNNKEGNLINEPIVVADAKKYRGKLISVSEDGKIIKLGQVEGTDFGLVEIEISINEDAKTNFDLSKKPFIVDGYYEVYYGEIQEDNKTDAIAINYLADNYNDVITNCEVVSVDTTNGSILVKKLSNNEEVQFNYIDDGSTQIYMNIEDIKDGVQLNIYHSPVSTRSLPPQYFALEISPYKSA